MDELVDSRSGIQGLLEGVEREIGAQRACDTPANDHPGEDVDDERDVDEAGPRRHVGEIGDPSSCPVPSQRPRG